MRQIRHTEGDDSYVDPVTLLHYREPYHSSRYWLQVPFLRTWFAEHYVDGFSVSLYYKRGGGSDAVFGALVTNGDCKDEPGFSMRAMAGNQLLSKIRTDSGGVNSLTGNISVRPR